MRSSRSSSLATNLGGHSQRRYRHDRGFVAKHVGLHSKPSTQADLESDWAAYWISEIKSAHIFHRKLWEFAYVLRRYSRMGDYIPAHVAWVSVVVPNLCPVTSPAEGSTSL